MALNNEIYKQVRRLLHDRYAYPIEQIQPESRFQIELAIDSLEMFEIITEFEENFNITISYDDIDEFIFQSQNIKYVNDINFLTIKDAVNYIERQIDNQNKLKK